MWPWERSDETGWGGATGSLSVIRSGFVPLRRDLLPEPALETPRPLPPAPGGPSLLMAACLIYMWESCDGAPSLASFVLLRAPSPPPPSSTLRQQERQQFYRSRKLVGEMKRLQPVHASVIICGLLQTHLTPQTPKCWKQVAMSRLGDAAGDCCPRRDARL